MAKILYPARVFLKEGNPGEWGERDFINMDLVIPSMLCGGMPLGYGIYEQSGGECRSVARFQSKYNDFLLRWKKMMPEFAKAAVNQFKERGITPDNEPLKFDYNPIIETYTDGEQNILRLKSLTWRQRNCFEKEILNALSGK